LNAQATTENITTFLRNLQFFTLDYNRDLLDGRTHFPDRVVQVRVTDGANHTASATQTIVLPDLTDFQPDQGRLILGANVGGVVNAMYSVKFIAYFDNSQTVRMKLSGLTFQSSCTAEELLIVVASDSVELRTGPDSGKNCRIEWRYGNLTSETCVSILARANPCALRTITFYIGCGNVGATAASPTTVSETSDLSIPSFLALESLMKNTAEGTRLAELYRRHSPELVQIIMAHPELYDRARHLVTTFQPMIVALLSGSGGTSITPEMITQVDAMWNAFKTYASPELATALSAERVRTHGFSDFIGKNAVQWATILNIAVPSAPVIQLTDPIRTKDQFSVDVNYLENSTLFLERTGDFSVWSDIPGLTRRTNGYTVILTDPAPAPKNSFYRAVAK
jgi:hypothetical protein